MKGVGIFANTSRGLKLRSAGLAFFMFMVLMCSGITSNTAYAIVSDPSQSLVEGRTTEKIGRTLLVEEVTTTWCPTCADIDPYLKGVADAHGSRIAMVAYHPSDGEDAFQPPAAQHRLERLGILHGNSLPSPTFFVEGKNPRSGVDAWSDVQRDILNEEIIRQDTSSIQLEIAQNGSEITARILSFESPNINLNGTQLTFLVIEHNKRVPENTVNPGEKTRDRVLVATAECKFKTTTVDVEFGLSEASVNESCGTDFSISFALLEQFSVLLLHENTEEVIVDSNASLGTYGSVEFAYRTRDSSEQSWPLSSGIIVLSVGAGLWAILPRKDEKS